MRTLKLRYWRMYWLLKAGMPSHGMYASAALMGCMIGLVAALA